MSAMPTAGPFAAEGFNVYSDSLAGVTVAYCLTSPGVNAAGTGRITDDEARANAMSIAAALNRSDPAREAMREALERAILGIQAGLDLAVATRRADHESFFRNRIKDARAALALDGGKP